MAESRREAWNAFVDYSCSMGIDNLTLAMGKNADTLSFLTTTSNQWMQHYLKEYQHTDHRIDYCNNNVVPVFDGLEFLNEENTIKEYNPNSLRMLQAAHQHQYRSMLIIPIRDYSGHTINGLNFMSRLKKKDFKKIISIVGAELQIAAQAHFYKNQSLAEEIWENIYGHFPVKTNLTNRESEILKLAANGNKLSEIAIRLSIKLVTVNHHIANIKRKLSAATLPQAVAIALSNSLIKLQWNSQQLIYLDFSAQLAQWAYIPADREQIEKLAQFRFYIKRAQYWAHSRDTLEHKARRIGYSIKRTAQGMGNSHAA